MIFKSIKITEGLFSRYIEFTDNANLVYSQKNSKGKTTLLRFLLYSLGYSIPNTRKIKFERCEVETVVFSEKVGEIKLSRTQNNYIVYTLGNESTTYVLPEQLKELHSIIFGTDNIDILDNLLGAFYVDQEKGWTLLNRGVVIGSIHFNIESLIRGLSGRDCAKLLQQEASLSRELGKYKQMFSVAKYQETIQKDSGSVAVEPYEEKIDLELEQLRIRQKNLMTELRRVDKAINDNKQFSKFIAEMKLLVKAPDGTKIPVTVDNILGFDDSIEYLIAKRKLVSSELATVLSQIGIRESKKQANEEQLAFWESETMAQAFDRKIASLQINAVSIENEIKRIEKELKKVRQSIADSTRSDNDIVKALYQNVLKYATELDVGNDTTLSSSYLFTSNLKELSGAILHKTVFSFRLAYIIEIEKKLNIKLPIILDSPSGKEVDPENIKLMMDILKRDFSDHQIIIASIFKYEFNPLNIIEIVNQLIEIV